MPLTRTWIAIDHGDVILRWPPLAFLLVVLLLSYLFSVLFLRSMNEDRRKTLRELFRNNLVHAALSSALFTAFSLMSQPVIKLGDFAEFTGIVGIITLIEWSYFAIKLGRLCIFIMMFFSNMRVAFPLLFVNIATLILAVALLSVLAAELFSIQVMPLLATSAVASLVLGIALQDTLGNLFAGVALQMDKPYEIDHWVEVQSGSQKWVGKVHEISWRATVLVGFSDEMVTIPNRVMAQSTILNYSHGGKPFIRGQTIRVPYNCDVENAKKAAQGAAQQAAGVCPDLECMCYVSELSESYVSLRLLYYITDFSSQLSIGDAVQKRVLDALLAMGIEPAPPRISVIEKG